MADAIGQRARARERDVVREGTGGRARTKSEGRVRPKAQCPKRHLGARVDGADAKPRSARPNERVNEVSGGGGRGGAQGEEGEGVREEIYTDDIGIHG